MDFLETARNFILSFRRVRLGHMGRVLFDITVVPFVFLILIPGYGYLATFLITKKLLVIERDLASLVIGFSVFIIGGAIIFWTVWAFHRMGRGTPSPFTPTQKLVVRGPYAYCRNPMYLGALTLVAGLGILFHSLLFFILAAVEPLLYLLYVKLIEEKELEKRFGKDYQDYKKKTPFIIPFIPRS